MTPEILLADLVYARRLLEDGLSDPQVMTSLIARGINPLNAAEIVTDLRHNREPKLTPRYEAGAKPPGPAPEAKASPELARGRRRRRPSGVPWWALILCLVVIWALWYAWLKTGVESSRDLISHDKHALPEHPSKEIQR